MNRFSLTGRLFQLLVGAAAVFAGARVVCAQAGQFEFSDGDFQPAEWELVTFTQRGDASIQRKEAGGNPGPYIEVTLVEQGPGYAEANAMYLKKSAVYDPARGAIVGIDWSDDTKLFQGFGNGQFTRLALRQGAEYFFANGGPSPQRFWSARSNLNLSATSFYHIYSAADGSVGTKYDPAFLPDFSENGAPITFGFLQSDNNAGVNAYTLIEGVDNWKVVLHTAAQSPKPPVFTGIALGDGVFEVSLTGTAGQACEIQSSSDFLSWITRTNVVLAEGRAELTFPVRGDSAQFLRARVKE